MRFLLNAKQISLLLIATAGFSFPLIPVRALAQSPTFPVISSVAVSSITQSSAIVTWTTSEPATSRVDYSIGSSYNLSSPYDAGLMTNHYVPLTTLDPETVYHLRVRSISATGNESVGSDVSFTTQKTPDTTAPEEITSLSLIATSAAAFDLSWIAPGDDLAQGTSTSYEIRLSSTTIPGIDAFAWWNKALPLSDVPTPRRAGSRESFTTGNLATSTTYYFAVRASDEVKNVSPISVLSIRIGTTPTPILPPVSATTMPLANSTSPVPEVLASTTPLLVHPVPTGTPLPVQPPVAAPALLFSSPRVMTYGMRSPDVKTLQRILIAKGFLKKGSDSGFFGLQTQRAVQKFQCAQKIICSGSPRTSGYGVVGAKTRAKLGGIGQ